MTTTSTASGAALAAPSRRHSPLITVIVLCFGGLSAALCQTIVIPIQGQLGVLLHTSEANASWVVTATLVAGAVAMPIAGRLGDMFGKPRVLLALSLLLLVGSAVCALSDSVLPMLVGRVLQGFAMGFIPVGMALMREVTPPRLAASSIAAMSATLGVGGAIALPLAAWIVQDFSWHTLFWVTSAVGALMAVAVLVFVPKVEDAVGGRFDGVGATGLTLGLVLLLVAISKGNEWGWGHGRTVALLAAGVLVLVAWGSYELRVADPLCDLRVTVRRPVLLTNLAAAAIGFGIMAQGIVIPRLLLSPVETGYGLGQDMLHTGLWMAPGGLFMMIFSPLSGRLIRVLGARVTLMIGAAVLGAGYVFAVFLTDAPWQLLVASCITSAGVGIGYSAMPTLILENVPVTEAGSAVGINGLMRSVGGSVASAVMIAVLTASTMDLAGHTIPSGRAFTICFVIGAIASFVTTAVAGFVPRRVADRPTSIAA